MIRPIILCCVTLLFSRGVRGAAPDWLVHPESYIATIKEFDQTIVLENGIARRTIKLSPNAATVDFLNLRTGEQLLRAVSPEARVTINGTAFEVGGLQGQKLKNCLTAEEQKTLQANPQAYTVEDWKIGPIEARFAWKKRPEWLSTDLPWPPPGKHLAMRYAPPQAPPQALAGPVLFEDKFQGKLTEEWKVTASHKHPSSSFSNEGKAGEILALPDTCVYAEKAWPPEAQSIEVILDSGNDTVSNAWGPGIGLLAEKKTLAFNVRPNQEKYEINGRLFDGFNREKPSTLRIRLEKGQALCEVSQNGEPFRLLVAIEFAAAPKSFRIGKLGPNAKGQDYDGETKNTVPVRCHLQQVTIRGADKTSKETTPRADLPEITVHYEIYDHLPLFSKWLTVHNKTNKKLRINHFVSEELRVVEADSKGGSLTGKPGTEREFPNVWVETDMAFGGRMSAFDDNHSVWWLSDPDYHTHVNYQFTPPCLLQCKPCAFLLPGRPSLGPETDLAAGETFESFRAFELLVDSNERERRTLAQRRMYRTIAPWTAENPLMFHKVHSDPKTIREALAQAKEVGFEMVIMSFGSGFNFESSDPAYRAVYKQLADEAKEQGIALGGYSLLGSRSAASAKDNTQGAPTMFGQMPCLGTEWGRQYLQKIGSFMRESGLTVFENDGSYPGDCCAAKNHPYHRGLEDSQWVMWRAITDFYKQCRAEGIYLNIPDWYFLSGGNKCAMGYREANWSLPRDQQELIERQNIFDGTWNKTASMGWMMVPLSEYQGGGGAATIEPLHEHLDHYDRRFANLLGAGVQACYRGPRLYDTDKTKAVVKKWVAWYKQHRAILDSDIIHLRRADGRDLDYILHVNPAIEEKGLLMVYNPLPDAVTKKLTVPLYYTGLTESAECHTSLSKSETYALDAQQRIELTVQVPGKGYTWFIFKQAPNLKQ